MNKISFPMELKNQVFKRDNFTCQKCSFKDPEANELEICNKFGFEETNQDPSNFVTLCSICYNYFPEEKNQIEKYLNEKIEGKILETFRLSERSISKKTKRKMISLFNEGKLLSKAPLGYIVKNNQLIPTENSKIIKEIYQDFLNLEISLTQLSKKYNLSVNGLKKILTNETYLGKLKFSGEIIQGKHPPLISPNLFNQVKEKIKNLKIKIN
jgi:hypothetical protein